MKAGAARIQLEPQWLAGFCARWHVRRLSLFGSVLREDFEESSDVDVLVEFEEGKSPGFFGIAKMEQEISAVVGQRRIDIRTPHDLSPYFREDVLKAAQVQYATS